MRYIKIHIQKNALSNFLEDEYIGIYNRQDKY